MKKLIMLLSLAALAVTLVAPAAAMAQDSKSIAVYAPTSSQPVTEDDVLNYVASVFTSGYINDTHYSTQSTFDDRMAYLKDVATMGFDPNVDDPFIWAVLLPNSATVEKATTWFGHPIVKNGDSVLIKGWFTNNTDADVIFLLVRDERYKY
jgi:hypothetical protein